MDPSLTSSGVIATIGIGTVFFALVMLIGMVTVIARFLGPSEAELQPAASAPSAGPIEEPTAETSEDEPAVPDFQQIALAAYALHRRTTTRVKSDEPTASWTAAGRIRELGRRQNRN